MSCAWRMSPSIQHQSVMIDHDPIQQQPSHQAGQARLNDGRSRTDSHGSCLVVSVCLKGTWREPIKRLLKLEWDELVDHAGEDSRSIRKYSTKCRAADRDDGRQCSAMVRDTFEWSLQWILATISWPWSSLSASPRPRPSSAGWASVASRSRTWSKWAQAQHLLWRSPSCSAQGRLHGDPTRLPEGYELAHFPKQRV